MSSPNKTSESECLGNKVFQCAVCVFHADFCGQMLLMLVSVLANTSVTLTGVSVVSLRIFCYYMCQRMSELSAKSEEMQT